MSERTGSSSSAGREVRTSASHPIQVNWLPEDVCDRVGLTFAPGKRDRSQQGGFYWERDLAADLQVLSSQHVSVLVSLMEEAELAAKGITNLVAVAQAHGIEVIRFPIRDVSAPRDWREVDRLLADLETRLARGARVVMHCLGGIGRTGTIATCLLVRRGVPLARAIQIVQDTRCKGFPEGPDQGPFVHAFAAKVGGEQVARSRDQVVELLATTEREVSASPASSFVFAVDGTATLTLASRGYHAGRFEVPTLGALRTRARAIARSASGHIRLSILRGVGVANDIGSLQATAPAGTLFQVASQFNCLEAPGPKIVPVRDYPYDATQGPRASVSAFPGTFLRHYQALRDGGVRFVQRDHDCIDLLADVTAPAVATVKTGYLLADRIVDPEVFARTLDEQFNAIRVGLHDDLEVVLGHNWGGAVPIGAHHIAQAFTSTIALGSYSHDDGAPALARIRRQLLRAAYLGTLLGAVALGKHTVVLTLIGGGAFGNPHRDIWDAIHWAIDEVEELVNGTLEVVVNVRNDTVEAIDLDRARARGGMRVETSAMAGARDVWSALMPDLVAT